MLNFVKSVFRNFLEVILWINLILCIIAGVIIGNTMGGGVVCATLLGRQNIFSGIIGAIIGGIIGMFVGLLINIIGGGFIATILNIDVLLEEQTKLLRRSIISGSSDNEKNRPLGEINSWFG